MPESPQLAWNDWARNGVAQFRQPHNFMPGLRSILEAELPDIQDGLRRAGASRFDLLHPLPPPFTDRSARAIDDQLWTYTARRPAGEWVFAHAAQDQARLTLQRGVQAVELITGPSVVDGTPHVVGVRTATGAEHRADLVVDAMGRASRSPRWLAAVGARAPKEEQADCGFSYYSRYFHGTEPQRMAPTLMPLGTISVLTLPGDNGTWSVTLFTAAGDRPLKNLRHDDTWARIVRACPLYAHWLDGEPITDVLAMSGVVDRYRRFVVDGAPVVTGFVAVADAWASTNPSAGRGLTVGLKHAVLLRETLRIAPDPHALVRQFDEATENEVASWFHAQIAMDRFRFAQMEALREGRPQASPTDELTRGCLSLLSTMSADPDLFRAGLEYIGTITPIHVIVARPEVARRITAVMDAMQTSPPPPSPGPDRSALLQLVS